MYKFKYISLTLTLALILPLAASAAVMSSTNYAIQNDSINFAGGLSTSSSYTVQDTVGEVGTGFSTSANYTLSAGYQQQQMAQSYVAISFAPSVVALGSISGLTGGSSLGSSTWTVTTNDPAGYAFMVQSTSSPAMQGDHGDNIADYAPSGAVPDLSFSISANQSAFGFSSTGVDTVLRYRNDGLNCGAGAVKSPNNCWDGFSTSPKTVSQSAGPNEPNGATTTVTYQAQIGSARAQTSGSYSATITVTAVEL